MTKAKRAPAIELVDISTLSEQDWHIWRSKGIGGSDLAAIMGLSPWATCRDIYYKKVGVVGALDKEADKVNWVAKEVGHLLEPLVAKIFEFKTGLKPFAVRKMFAHPIYPYMIANLDYMIILPDGRRAILECKTTNHHAKDKWDDDAVPVNYELQCRHYMAVMDIDVVYIACLMGNNEADFVWRRIDRNLAYEEDIIATEVDFWQNNVVARVEPQYTEDSDLVLQSIRNHFGYGNKDADEVMLAPGWVDSLLEYERLKAEKSKLEKEAEAIKDRMTLTQALIVEEMGVSCKATCKGDDVVFTITNNPILRDNVDKDGLKAKYPAAFDEFIVKKPSTPRFTVKRAKAKAS